MLTVNSFKDRFKVRVAEEDIIAYKILVSNGPHDKRPVTPYRNSEVRIGVPMKSKLRMNYFTGNVSKGYHAFQKEIDAIIEAEYLAQKFRNEWYSFTYYSAWDNDFYNPFRIYKAIIPKGAKYYTGRWLNDGSRTIASDTMIFEVIPDTDIEEDT